MYHFKIFISSIQSEFAKERESLYEHFKKDALLNEPPFYLEEGFKVILWWLPKTTDHVTDQDTGQVSGQATGQFTEQTTGQVSENVRRVLLVIHDEMKSTDIQEALQLKHREYFRDNYLILAMDEGNIEMTIPDKPYRPNQKYRLTKSGLELKKKIN
ncbi:MAG TPA: hypothetical protein PK563_14970 [Tenuifilaceae bacterium]|nr:hypothetical protein [Tenuifilaceae bacterium]